MYTLYTADTPNGRKATIAFEELGLPYECIYIDLSAGEQHSPQFLAISPNNKIPAIVCPDDGEPIFESGAILMHLADRTGRLLPPVGINRTRVLEWLFMQIGSVGPMLGQLWWFRHGTHTPNTQALERYIHETHRIYGVIERRLTTSLFVGSEEYTIADIAMFSWLNTYDELGVDIQQFPSMLRWLKTIEGRPAVQRGLEKATRGKTT